MFVKVNLRINEGSHIAVNCGDNVYYGTLIRYHSDSDEVEGFLYMHRNRKVFIIPKDKIDSIEVEKMAEREN